MHKCFLLSTGRTIECQVTGYTEYSTWWIWRCCISCLKVSMKIPSKTTQGCCVQIRICSCIHLIVIPVRVWLQDYSRKIKKYKTSRSGTSFIFMNGINKYGHTIRMARCHAVCIFRSPRSPIEGWENLSWLEAESNSSIGSQEIVGGTPRDHGLSGPRAGVELQAVKS